MVERQEEKRPFSDTQEFVQKAFEERFLGETEVALDSLDKTKPYTQIGDKVYQAEFNTEVMKAGDEIPLVSIPISDKPGNSIPSGKRRPNAALLYIFPDDTDTREQIKKGADSPSRFQSLEEIGKSYKVTKQLVHQDLHKYLSILYEISSDQLKSQYPMDELHTTRPTTLATKINSSRKNGIKSSLTIIKDIREGKARQELLNTYGKRKIWSSRRIIAGWGIIDGPEKTNRNLKSAIAKIEDPVTTIDELRVLIEQFKNQSSIQTYKHVFLPIVKIQMEAWRNRNPRKSKIASDYLKEAGLPVYEIKIQQVIKGKTEVNYYRGTFKRLEDMAVEVLKEHSEEIGASVIQVAGDVADAIPTTTELCKTKKGMYVRVSKKKIAQILEEQNIPVFKTKDNSYFISKDNAHL